MSAGATSTRKKRNDEATYVLHCRSFFSHPNFGAYSNNLRCFIGRYRFWLEYRSRASSKYDDGVIKMINGKSWNRLYEVAYDLTAKYEDERIFALIEDAAVLADKAEQRHCQMVDIRWDDGQCTWGCQCTRCETRFEHQCAKYMRFCPECGAEVVEDDH